jgi:hypothetical protein
VYVDLDDDRYSRPRMLKRVAKALQIGEATHFRRSTDALMEVICERLYGQARVIFIDNAHLLDVRNLWTLHTIHDRTGSTIVCMGQPLLYDTLVKSRQDRGIGATLFARFGVKLVLTDAIESSVDPSGGDRVFAPDRDYLHTLDDVEAFLESRRLRVHPAAVEWLHKLVNCPTEGGFHTLEDVVDLAADAYSDVAQLTLAHFLAADKLVRPHADQKLILDAISRLRPARPAAMAKSASA